MDHGLSNLPARWQLIRWPLILRPLEKQGFLHTEPGEDRRERVLTLTNKGKGLIEKAYPLWKEVQGRIVKQFGKKRWDGLMGDLSDFIEISRKK